MALIDDAQAKKFCNEEIRPLANALAQLYARAKRVGQAWTARQMGNVIAYDNADAVVDGAETDGRPIMSGVAVNNIVNRANEFVAELEADGGAKLNTILAVAPKPGGDAPE